MKTNLIYIKYFSIEKFTKLLRNIKKDLDILKVFSIKLSLKIAYLAAFAASKTTEKASGSLTAKSASIFLLTTILAFLQALTNLE